MSTIAMDLENFMSHLTPPAAREVERRVRLVIANPPLPKPLPNPLIATDWAAGVSAERLAEREEIMQMVREKKPHLLEFVGCFEDIPFEVVPDDLPLPPSKEW
jgi:hypothetical protein